MSQHVSTFAWTYVGIFCNNDTETSITQLCQIHAWLLSLPCLHILVLDQMDKVAKDIQPRFHRGKDQAISEWEKIRELAGQCSDKQEALVAHGSCHEQTCLPTFIPTCENSAASSSCVAYETSDMYSPISQDHEDIGRWCMKCSATVRGNEFICPQWEQPTNEMGKRPMLDDVAQTFARASSDRVGAAHSQTTAKVEMIPAQGPSSIIHWPIINDLFWSQCAWRPLLPSHEGCRWSCPSDAACN